MEGVYIYAAARIPTGKYFGAYKDIPITNLAAYFVEEFLRREHISPEIVDGLYFGNVNSAGLDQAPARRVALGAGLGEHVDTSHFEKVCASSLLSVEHAYLKIHEGKRGFVIAGGMESMTRAPLLFPRFGKTTGDIAWKDVEAHFTNTDTLHLCDSIFCDTLRDAYSGLLMGQISEKCAKEYKLTREELDYYGFKSYSRAEMFSEHIKKQFVLLGERGITLAYDEGWRAPDIGKMKSLSGVFFEDGLLTPANSSQFADGVSAVILVPSSRLECFMYKEKRPLARIIAISTFSTYPDRFPVAPVFAIQNVCKDAGIPLHLIDYFEVNEAFATEPLIVMKELGIDHGRMNVCGGAIANGHPLGASGTKILSNLCYILKNSHTRYGIASACNGGGEAVAILIENCQK